MNARDFEDFMFYMGILAVFLVVMLSLVAVGVFT